MSPPNKKSGKSLHVFFAILKIFVAVFATLLGLVVLIGWYTQNTSLIQIYPTFVPMQYNTALGFFLCGVSLFLTYWKYNKVALICGILVFLLGTISSLQYLLGVNFGIDELFMKSYILVKTSHPGRMAPNTGICFAFSGLCIGILNSIEFRRKGLIVTSLGTVIFALGIVALTGYSFNIISAYGWSGYTNMAVHTAFGFVSVGLFLFLCGIERRKKSSVQIYYLPIISLFLGFTITLCVWQAYHSKERDSIEETVILESEILKDSIKRDIKFHILELERMGERWEVRGGTPRSEWESDANLYIQDFESYEEILWMDTDFYVRWVASLNENNKLLNLNVGSKENRRKALEKIRDNRLPVISRSINLINGGQGILVYIPLYVNGEFDGFIVGIWKVEKLFDSFLPEKLTNNYNIKILDSRKEIYRKGNFSDNISENFTQKQVISLYGNTFELVISPKAATISRFSFLFDESILLIGVIFSIIFAWAVYLVEKVRRRSDDTSETNSFLEQEVDARKRMEKILRETSSFREAILNSSNHTIISTDTEGKILTFNEAAEKALGYKAIDLVRKETPAIIHDLEEVIAYTSELNDKYGYDIKPGFETFVARSKFDNVPDEKEWTYIRKDGTSFPVMLTVTSLRDENDEIIGYLGIGRDISELKDKSNKLLELEERFRTFMDNSPVASYMKDSQGRYTYVSKVFEDSFGIKSSDLIGKTDFSWLPEKIAERIEKVQSKVLETKKPFETVNIIDNGDGSQNYWLFIAFPVFDGLKDYYLGVVGIDITELEEANKELKKSEERFQAFMDNSPTSSFIKNPNGEYIYINKVYAENSIFDGENILGKTDAFWADDKKLAIIEKEEKEVLTENKTIQKIDIVKTKDGTESYWLFVKFPIFDEHGKVNLGGIAFDITDRKKLEEELEHTRDVALESVRLKSEFLANMSHEIRTPMNGIMGMLDILLTTDLQKEQKDYALTMQESADSLLTIINDILDFSKIEAGKLTFENINFDLRTTVESTIDIFAEAADRKNLNIASFIKTDIPVKIIGDPGRLRQILTNLIGNAIKFTESGEVVTTIDKVNETDSHVELSFEVKDTGIGISEEAQKYLFQAFTQADGSMTRKYGGTGLGLTISKQLIELMNGEISVESKLGEGSVFRFTASFEKQPNQDEDKFKPRINLEEARVLVVDDNATNRKIITHQIEFWGVYSTEADNGLAAVEILRKAARNGKPYDVVMLDLMMPDTSGFDTAKIISEDPEINNVKVVLMPSFGQRGHAKKARNTGVSAYIVKPIRQSELFDCLATLLGNVEDESKVLKEKTNKPKKLITRYTLDENRIAKNVSILIAEDNLVNQKVTRMQLELLGYNADVVSNGKEVLEALEKKSYSIILMDCQMPILDGYEATTEIRLKEKDTNEHIPIVAITANALEGEREKCIKAGMDDYLTKPFKQDELEAIINKWIAKPESKSPDSVTDEDSEKPDTENKNAMKPDANEFLDDIQERLNELKEEVGEEMIEMIISLFAEDSFRRLEKIRKHIDNKDLESIAYEAHSLKGSSSNIGANYIAELCFDLETKAKNNEEAEIESLFEKIEANIQALAEVIEDLDLQVEEELVKA